MVGVKVGAAEALPLSLISADGEGDKDRDRVGVTVKGEGEELPLPPEGLGVVPLPKDAVALGEGVREREGEGVYQAEGVEVGEADWDTVPVEEGDASMVGLDEAELDTVGVAPPPPPPPLVVVGVVEGEREGREEALTALETVGLDVLVGYMGVEETQGVGVPVKEELGVSIGEEVPLCVRVGRGVEEGVEEGMEEEERVGGMVMVGVWEVEKVEVGVGGEVKELEVLGLGLALPKAVPVLFTPP